MKPVLYLLMRNDIPSMNPGKLAAQACHVGHCFMGNMGIAGHNTDPVYLDWLQQTNQNFGTTITKAVNKGDLLEAIMAAKTQKVPSELVADPTYPCQMYRELVELLKPEIAGGAVTYFDSDGPMVVVTRNEIVGGYIFGDAEDKAIRALVSSFPLYH
jgi:peptidyl-tRNA hydrolase